jgi:hypothetical protein
VGPGGGQPAKHLACYRGGDTLMGWLHGDTLQEAVELNSKLKVGGG